MAENVEVQSTSSIEENGSPSNALDEIVRDANDKFAQTKEMAEAAKGSAKEAAESQVLIAAALTTAQAKLVDITSTATQALAAKTQIEGLQSVIATKSDHIQKAQDHADKVRADLDRTLTAAKQQATEAEGQNTRTQSAADTAGELITEIRTIKGAVESEAAAVTTSRKNAEASASLAKALADKSTSVEERIGTYEKRLAELDAQCTDQLKQIESLLPGATSAGMAHALDERRQTFLRPQRKWENWFIGSLSAIVLLAGASLVQVFFSKTPFTYDELLLLWLSRLPVAGALVWLALHSSHEAALAKRLEEDYGYKSAIASMFIGFQKQMSAMGSDAESNKPLSKLCEDTLKTIASPPGRIYDQHKMTASPIGELTEAATTVVDKVKT